MPPKWESAMTYDSPPVFIPASPEYILDVIRDSHRQQCQYDSEADPGVELTFETTIAEWRYACDLLGWRRLGRALEGEWKLGRRDSDWREILEPARKRTLGDVCRFIASGAVRPTIKPLNILGATCRPAGAFLAIRSLLREAGVDADSVAPSTPLHEYTRRYPDVFLGAITRLAPNTLPPVRFVVSGWFCMVELGVVLGFMAAAIGWVVSPLATAGGVVAIASWMTGRVVARSTPLFGVEFGGLRTFRDLAVAIAEGAQAIGGRV